jgi:VWFA-related protein
MRAVSLVLAVAASAAVPARAQAPAEPKPAAQAPEPAPAGPAPPVFGVGVDVVAVDASVVDGEGRPVLGLGPQDFGAEVDGKPRRVLSLEYVGREFEPAETTTARPDTHFSTNESQPRGRLILVLVDRGNIGQGGGREVLRAAERFLGTLAPADRVGLVFIPGPGPSIEFTSDLDLIRRGLKGVVGQAPRGGHEVPLAEAIALVRDRNQLRWSQWVELRCGSYRIMTAAAACRDQMEVEANQVYLEYRDRSLASQRALGGVLRSLRGIEGPKTVILISEGLGTERGSEARDLAVAASEAQVTLFVLLLNTSASDAAFSRSVLASSEDREAETEGLYDLAGLTRGTVLHVVGAADNAFRRVSRELAGYYLLGLEPDEGDRDGRNHTVKVTVARPNVTVRARGLLNIPASPPVPEALLVAALRSPLVEQGLAVRTTAYAMRDGATGKVRLLIAAQVGRATRPLMVGFALSNAGGKVAASRAYPGIAGGGGDWVEFTGEAVVDPDRYTLRLAAVDAAGRRGSVEHTVKAALVDAGGVQVSDLVLAPASGGAAARPAVGLEISGGNLAAFLEVGSKDAGRLEGAGVAVELAESADSPALLRVPVALQAPSREGTRAAQVEVPAGLLPPGDYTARAEVSVEGKAVAVVTRPFRIVPPRAGEAPSSAPLARLLVESPPFERADLLQPEVLGPLVDVVNTTVRAPAPSGVVAAIEEARQGRPEAMLDHLGGGKEDARVDFLRGVSYYARGNLPAALTRLQAALRLSSELFPAAVYMGACYAAAGKDLDAIGAWQTALIGESASPTLYALLADALLRVKEEKQAVEILTEGLAAFPDDPGLRRRLGIAHAMAGDDEEALPLLTAWVEANPGDTRALFATLALLFQGFSREAAGTAPVEERQRLVRFAKAYVDGKGPNREVVGRWLRYLESDTDHSRGRPAVRGNDPG